MCVGIVCTHPSYNDKNPPSIFFLNPLSQIRLSWEWRSSVQASPTIVDWQDHLTSDLPWVSCELSAIVSTGAGENNNVSDQAFTPDIWATEDAED